MEVGYKKDIRNSYLVIQMTDNCSSEAYCVNMLQENRVEGIIKPEPRNIDNRVLYYYDITSRQSLETVYIKKSIRYEKIKNLFMDLADIIERTYEYLLNENDLVLKPEHIYMDLDKEKTWLCYLPGYGRDIGAQITALVEYIMNKVEYSDKEAVLYTYNLYAACRDGGFSFNHLLSVIRGDKQEGNKNMTGAGNKEFILGFEESKEIHSIPEDGNINYNHGKNAGNAKKNACSEKFSADRGAGRHIPVMMEEVVTDEKEIYYYPLTTYIYTAACVIGAVCLVIIAINMKLVFTAMGNRLDYGKITALILVLMIITGYLMKIIWNKRNRLTRIVRKQDYIDPTDNDNTYIYKSKETSGDKVKETGESVFSEPRRTGKQEDKPEMTVLLNSAPALSECRLEPENKDNNEIIQITDFPFVIGKLKNHVDYCLNKDVVSRFHVKITKEDEGYFITDLNSTNGTTVNDKPLPCYQKQAITRGDRIAIAGIKYVFHSP
ncbi:MAG: FHA domain-containing protein [Clostridiales bacterium]|nr:FHA domain-containing protein [Clostridiales bacterium]